MDPEQTFLRVHARLSSVLARLLTPKFRAGLEYLCILNAVMLLSLLVVMHVNFVAQPGCAEHFTDSEVSGAQLIQIKITGSWNRFTEETLGRGMWMHETSRQQFSNDKQNRGQSETEERYQSPGVVDDGWNILAAKFWLNFLGTNARRTKSVSIENIREIGRDDYTTVAETGMEKGIKPGWQSGKEESFGLEVTNRPMSGPGRGPLGTALLHYLTRWSSYGASCFKRAEQSARSFWQVWRITGWEPFTNAPKGDRRTVAWNKLDSVLVDLPENRSTMFDPTYLYSIEKGYLMMSESAKLRHNVKTVNVSILAQHSCFGNQWQQLLIDNLVGYDTILMNSLLSACGRGYLYNFQTKELHNLNYLQEFGRVSNGIEDRKKPNLPAQKLPGLLQLVADYIVFKCGVLITSLFIFFTTTMSVSFTLRETQARMLKFTVQLQHHARHRLPTYRLIFIHVVESLVFVPIMIGILFFLFEFFDDQLLAFMVLTLVWLCELFTMISVRTPLSVQFFPWFFFLYFMVFHIYFFSYTYGFSYLAFSATAAFMQHLVLYFWNRYEVPALQNILQRRALLQEQGVQITSSSILTSTVQVTRASNTNMSSQIIRGVAGLNNLRVGSADGPTGLRSSLTSSGPGTPSRSRGPSTPQDVTVDLASNTSSNSDVNTNLPNGAGFEPLGRGWINSSIHDTDNNIWRRSIELDRLRRDTEREALVREHGRNTGLGPGFGVQPTGDGQTPSLLRPTPPISPYGSVLPWILGSPSLFLPVFHGLGNDSPGSQNIEERGDLDTPTITNSTNSTTPDTVVAEAPEATEGGLRNRHVRHPMEEGQTP